MRKALTALAVFLGAGMAMANGTAEPVAVMTTRSGTVAPPYQWHWTAQVFADGRVTVESCRGTTGPGPAPCRLLTGTATPEAVARIGEAAQAEGLFDRPAAEDPRPPVGGGSTSGAVTLDGRTAALPAFPAEADHARVRAVLEAISAAIPPETRAAAETR